MSHHHKTVPTSARNLSLEQISKSSRRKQNQESSEDINTSKRNQTVTDLPKVDKFTSSKTADASKTAKADIPKTVNLTNVDRTTTPKTVNLTNVDRNITPKTTNLTTINGAMKSKTTYLTKVDIASSTTTTGPRLTSPPQINSKDTKVPQTSTHERIPTANTTQINPQTITQSPNNAPSYLRTKGDQTFASRQMTIDVLPLADRIRQDRWVQSQIKLMGPCPANYNWVRRDKYYQCEGLHHVITDLSLTVGRGAMFLHPATFIPSLKEREPVWDPYFKKGEEEKWTWGGAEEKPELAPDWFVGSEVGFEREGERRAFEDAYWKAVEMKNPHMVREFREETQRREE